MRMLLTSEPPGVGRTDFWRGPGDIAFCDRGLRTWFNVGRAKAITLVVRRSPFPESFAYRIYGRTAIELRVGRRWYQVWFEMTVRELMRAGNFPTTGFVGVELGHPAGRRRSRDDQYRHSPPA